MTNYADTLDRAAELEELERQSAINNMKRHNNGLIPTGECHWCEEQIQSPKIFCDASCARKWSYHNE